MIDRDEIDERETTEKIRVSILIKLSLTRRISKMGRELRDEAKRESWVSRGIGVDSRAFLLKECLG